MTKRTTLVRLCAAILVVAALAAFSVPAMAADAASIQEQMAQNSAAWHIANNAGDVETCSRLHAENERLSALLAQGGGTAVYDENGTWTIVDAGGSVTSSAAAGLSGKDPGIVYTTAGVDGSISAEHDRAYTDTSIDAYMNNGGTHSGLSESYNNAAQHVADTNNYESYNRSAAEQEIAVAKELLGLTDAQAAALQASITAQKAAYSAAQTQYDIAVASGNTSAAAAAKTAMDAAHAAAQALRAQYHYTGDAGDLTDGGSYFGDLSGMPSVNPAPAVTPAPTSPPVQQFTITASAGSGGSISPSGSKTVAYGGSQAYTITPSTGYDIYDVKVDGKSVGAVRTYTFSGVSASHTISASFVEKTYSITASAGAGGSISPSGSRYVVYGGSQAYTITPSTGYDIYDVKVDGKSVGAVRTYVFSNVTAGHSISASFRPDPVVDMGSLTVTDTLGASLSGKSIKSGYGISISVPVTLDNVTDVSVALSYDFGFGRRTVSLRASGSKYVLPVNPDSPTGARCIYIPVETKDGSYTITASVTARDADGNTVTDTAFGTVTVKGSMYEDDFTGDS